MKAVYEMAVIDRFAEIANDSILQGSGPDGVIRMCGNEDRRNRVPQFDQAPVEFNAGHSWHVNVSDQAGGFRQ